MRRKSYSEEEARFQAAQERWEKNIDDISAWQEMFFLVRLACFNSVNKKLEKILPREKIEERSLDVTCNVMAGIRKKRLSGKAWKVGKLSSYVHLPCLAVYSKKLQFEDKTGGENEFINEGNEFGEEQFSFKYQQGLGFFKMEKEL